MTPIARLVDVANLVQDGHDPAALCVAAVASIPGELTPKELANCVGDVVQAFHLLTRLRVSCTIEVHLPDGGLRAFAVGAPEVAGG